MAKYWKLLFPSGHTASKLFSRRATTPQPLPPPPPSRPDRSESFWRTLAMIDSRNEKHSCQKCILVFVFAFHRATLSGLFCVYFGCFNFRSFKKMIFTWLANGKWMDLNSGPLESEAIAQPTEPQPLPSKVILPSSLFDMSLIQAVKLLCLFQHCSEKWFGKWF